MTARRRRARASQAPRLAAALAVLALALALARVAGSAAANDDGHGGHGQGPGRFAVLESVARADGGSASAAVVDDAELGVRFMRYGDSLLGAKLLGEEMLETESPFIVFTMMAAMGDRVARRQGGDRKSAAMLQLGLGAGSMPSIMHERGAFGRVDVVENSTTVARLALAHMNYRAGRIFLADAYSFIASRGGEGGEERACALVLVPPDLTPKPADAPQRLYKLVAQDLYMGWNPLHMLSQTTFRLVRDHWLDPASGVFMVNLVSGYRGPQGAFFRAVVRTLEQDFAHVACFRDAPPAHERDLAANLVCLAGSRPDLVDMGEIDLAQRAVPLAGLDARWVEANFHNWRVYPPVDGDFDHSAVAHDPSEAAILTEDTAHEQYVHIWREVEARMREVVRPMLPEALW